MPTSDNGDIKLSASFTINTEDVKRQSRELKKSMDSILQSNNIRKSPQLEKLGQQIQKSYLAVEKLQSKLQQEQSIKVPTAEYSKLQQQLEEARAKTEELAEARKKWESASGTGKYLAAGEIQQIDKETDLVLNKMEQIEQKMADLEGAGRAFEFGDSAKVSAITQQLHFATQNGEQLVGRFQEAASASSGAALGASKMAGAAKVAATAVQGFGKVARSAFNAFRKGISTAIAGFKRIKAAAKNAFKSINSDSKKGLKTLIKYGLGVRSMFFLFRKLRGYATDAFKGIAQQSASFNKTMSNITNTFGQFKNSIGTALQPIITMIEPILIRIMELFINAANAVATFFATLTGQKYIYKATKANASYADSISDTGKAAKEANKQLAEYDKLQVIQQDNGSGGGGSGGGGGGFTEELVDADSAVSQFAQQLKEAWENADFAAIGEIIGNKINELTGRIDEAIKWENVGPKITEWVNNFGTAFNSLIDTVDWALIGQTIGDGLNTITYTIETFLDAFNIDEVGTKLAELANSLNDTIDWEAIGRTAAKGLGEFTDAINNFVDGVDWQAFGSNISTELTSFFENFDAESFGNALAAPIEAITETLNGFLTDFTENGAWATAGEKIGTVVNSWFSGVDWKTAADNLKLGIDGIVSTLQSTIDTISWEDIGKDLATYINGIFDVDWKAVGKVIGDSAKDILDMFDSAIRNVEWKKLGEDIVDLIMGADWPGIFQSAGTLFFDVIDAAMEVLTGALQKYSFFDVVNTLGESLTSAFSDINWDNFASDFSEMAGSIIGKLFEFLSLPAYIKTKIAEWGANLILKFAEWFAGKKDEWDEAGISIWEGIFQGIGNAIKNIATWIKEKILDPFITGFKNAFGIHSQSTVMAELGGNLIDGLKEGLSNIWNKVKEKFSEFWNGILSWFSEKWENFKNLGTKIVNYMKVGIGNIWNSVKEKFSDFWNSIKEWFSGKWESLKAYGSKIVTNIKSGIGTIWSSIKEKFSAFWTKIKEWFSGKYDSFKNLGTNIVDKLKAGIGDIWSKVKDKFNTLWTNIKNFWSGKKIVGAGVTVTTGSSGEDHGGGGGTIPVKKAKGGIISHPTHIIAGEAGPEAIIPLKNNTEWLDTVSKYVTSHLALGKLDIPHLAKGQVIPPNKQFLAVLGDQRQGTNVEVPLETIEQAVRNVLNERGENQAPIVVTIDGREIARAVRDEEGKRYKQIGKAYAY